MLLFEATHAGHRQIFAGFIKIIAKVLQKQRAMQHPLAAANGHVLLKRLVEAALAAAVSSSSLSTRTSCASRRSFHDPRQGLP